MDFNEFKKKHQIQPVDEFTSNTPNSPTVSICIVTYQHKDYIGQCIASVLKQETEYTFEILIGDDESSDGTREICQEYARKYPHLIRLFFHKRENNIKIEGHPTGRFNFMYSLFQAKGRYISLLDGDDFWIDPLKLQKQLDFLEENQDYSMVGHKVRVTDGTNLEDSITGKRLRDTYYFKDIAAKNVRIPTNSLVFRNNFEIPDWFSSIYGADRALIFLSAQTGKIKVMDFVGAVYRIHAGGIEQNYKKDKFSLAMRNLKVNSTYLEILPPNLRGLMYKNSAWNYYYLSAQYLLRGQFLKVLKNVFYSIKCLIKSI
ncbi:glycosyltransferase family 2 protein [Fulvivirga lutimaris]|uniref:glycosyltransferase family 2 protein n=1 Tax=Fulvivirga lutimaris TaxID=1819566 RepID=UPI0012BB86FD|nr:glycosyltransferase family 2 protein [Fulvivirga lutimaris]MTI38090.1 glycosyltransferase family 2 protein [Fulvivirga lutimaris]